MLRGDLGYGDGYNDTFKPSINVVDLVGLVPQEHLQGAIVRFQSWFGVALYEAGERAGDIVTLTLRMRVPNPADSKAAR